VLPGSLLVSNRIPAGASTREYTTCQRTQASGSSAGASAGSWVLVKVSSTCRELPSPGSIRCTTMSLSRVVRYSRIHLSLGSSCHFSGTTVVFQVSYCRKLIALKWVSSNQRTRSWSGWAAASGLKVIPEEGGVEEVCSGAPADVREALRARSPPATPTSSTATTAGKTRFSQVRAAT